jgi:hypothetical protein
MARDVPQGKFYRPTMKGFDETKLKKFFGDETSAME